MSKIFNFEFFQRIGKTFMVVISLLPAAGLLLGIGTTLQSQYFIEYFPFLAGDGWQTVGSLMRAAGSAIFSNLGILFAIGIAGSWTGGKAAAGLSAFVGYLIMHTVIGVLVGATPDNVTNPGFTTELGIPTLQVGVFGGIIMGFVAAALYQKFHDFQLPEVLSFFGGSRFVPIVTAAASILLGVFFSFVWPFVQDSIFWVGNQLAGENTPPFYLFIYGLVERALIPFGLHHIFYIPIRFSEIGGTYTTLAGQLVSGDTAMYMAQLADRQMDSSVEITAGRFMTGKYPFVLFGIPAIALAMYHAAKPENKKAVGGLLFTVAATAFLTGITEPLEFTFLFAAPFLYVFHCLMAGLSFMLMYMLDVNVGYAGGAGFIDFTLFGILPGVGEPWWLVIIIGLMMSVVYYFVFRFAIAKWNLMTPGRGDSATNKLTSKEEYNNKKRDGSEEPSQAEGVLAALGGEQNIKHIDACITRLRVSVYDKTVVNHDSLKDLGARGVIEVGNGIQAIYGPKAEILKNQINDIIEK
ncbi:glucose-specific PTS transporter subunit IIBC [Alkalicoccobacillus murimartini]|uniref:PTS system D-glucosamine-specific IIC component n=1 Tax=Alkalicoccobacillus murimartini TaxID=171685 RepID=A0ABT9YBW8_9BACI|nr:glucose-specific PTS transporter subunit IIBC [Alkalicoccobacillus murimartini]MDQ0205341.1 PTS system D-glucosamine-specific IIC component [Alkalicoccobacillus murimartini]